jgi:hypothetical protein
MPDVFNEMLHGWHNFYFMAGGAAAGLIGLMFVALLGNGSTQKFIAERYNTTEANLSRWIKKRYTK